MFAIFAVSMGGTLLVWAARREPVVAEQSGANNNRNPMALPFGETPGARDARALSILAKTIYRELRSSGFEVRHVMALAGELLGEVTSEVRAGASPRGPRGRT
jgi:hypothetical protein